MSPATVYPVGPSVQDVADILDLLQSVIPPQPGREFEDSVWDCIVMQYVFGQACSRHHP